MFLQKGSNRLIVVTDVRSASDAHYSLEHEGADSVLRYWSFGKAALGSAWFQTSKAALFNYGETLQGADKASRAEVAKLRSERLKQLRNYLNGLTESHTIVVLPTVSTAARGKEAQEEMGRAKGHDGTAVWQIFKGPGSLDECAGTVFKWGKHNVLPIKHPNNSEHVYRWAIEMWLKWALALSNRKLTPLTCDVKHIHQSEAMGRALEELIQSDRPIAFDIESFSTDNIITKIGVSDGRIAVSAPWDSFRPHGSSDQTPPCRPAIREAVLRLLGDARPKYGHNALDYDVPFLRERGCVVGGTVWDSYLLHGVVFRQFRHGLQQACTHSFLTNPWKSYHTASVAKNGLTKDDAEAWIQDPDELADYNCDDSHRTWHLGNDLKLKAGIR